MERQQVLEGSASSLADSLNGEFDILFSSMEFKLDLIAGMITET
ncbi:uncharacterized protein METZ01_LOCUS367249 [marine metagenome]|uniref:Uncharacterized protein n=1 Tax=marine metagenome TaxID=408172 RepID=A0A382SY70_9ZZZZ